MMPCPRCEGPTRALETRAPTAIGIRWVAELAEDWPHLTARRRRCQKCGPVVSIELPLADLQVIAREGWTNDKKAG